jgi:hypothetical protein
VQNSPSTHRLGMVSDWAPSISESEPVQAAKSRRRRRPGIANSLSPLDRFKPAVRGGPARDSDALEIKRDERRPQVAGGQNNPRAPACGAPIS